MLEKKRRLMDPLLEMKDYLHKKSQKHKVQSNVYTNGFFTVIRMVTMRWLLVAVQAL